MSLLYFLDVRASAVGGALRVEPQLVDRSGHVRGTGEAALRALARSHRHVTLLVHGFNVSRAAGIRAYRAFVDRLDACAPPPKTCFLGVLWPGDSTIGAVAYPFQERDAERTAALLAGWLGGALRKNTVALVAHSLGCRVVLAAIDALGESRTISDLVLLAGAVDGDALARSDRYRRAVLSVERSTVVSSRADGVLKVWFLLGDFAGSLLDFGYTRRALGFAGPLRARESLPISVGHFPIGVHRVDHEHYLAVANTTESLGVARLTAGLLARVPSPIF